LKTILQFSRLACQQNYSIINRQHFAGEFFTGWWQSTPAVGARLIFGGSVASETQFPARKISALNARDR
jgi:hypothetical protein